MNLETEAIVVSAGTGTAAGAAAHIAASQGAGEDTLTALTAAAVIVSAKWGFDLGQKYSPQVIDVISSQPGQLQRAAGGALASIGGAVSTAVLADNYVWGMHHFAEYLHTLIDKL